MNLEELTRRFRTLADDKVLPHLFDSEDIADWLTDAEAQAAVRGRLLLEEANPAVCQVAVLPGVPSYKLHAKLYELVAVRFQSNGATRATPLKLVSREWLDENVRDWREEGQASSYAVQSETGLRIAPVPSEAGVLLIEGYRLPLKALVNDNVKPEIHEASHEQLIHWALHRAFSVVDSETLDLGRAQRSEDAFTRHFGLPVDADMRRSTRTDEVQHNVVYVP